MTDEAILIGLVYLALVALVAVVGIGLWLSTRSRRSADAHRLAERETTWLVIVLAVLTALLAATIFFVPYGESAGDGNARVVAVVARQFGWQIRPARVPAGQPVEFRLTSMDVNHGFGVYDPDDRLIAQVQVMPGRTQRLVHTFDEPGIYRILCLEFCGFAHHGMVGQIEVTG